AVGSAKVNARLRAWFLEARRGLDPSPRTGLEKNMRGPEIFLEPLSGAGVMSATGLFLPPRAGTFWRGWDDPSRASLFSAPPLPIDPQRELAGRESRHPGDDRRLDRRPLGNRRQRRP